MNGEIEYHANGKLLLTGEYLVLAGATALALPLRFGQEMKAVETTSGILDWTSSVPDGAWFSARYQLDGFRLLQTTDLRAADFLEKLLKAAGRLNPQFLAGQAGFNVRVKANYPLEWGLGSSSSLICMVAAWAGTDPFDLHALVSKGSGFDIACAGKTSPIFYSRVNGKPNIASAIPGEAIHRFTYFAWLGNKQDTEKEVRAFLAENNYSEGDVARVSELSSLICTTGSGAELVRLVAEHEKLIGAILEREPIARRYPSFPGTVKSLGAWGGDFAMFVSDRDPAEIKTILHNLGMGIVFSYDEIKAAG
jgi:mevalonate kinase